MSTLILLLSAAHAGYGDPVDGVPNFAEREVHLWTNAVRTDPEYFRDDYPCSFDSFNVIEQTPQIPYFWHSGLGEIARLHSQDMSDNDWFSHSSSDGTGFGTRVEPYYPTPMVGENIAQGYPTPYSAVVEGWMCSTEGHRGAIMSPDFQDLGVGVVGTWYTQDFGDRDYDDLAFAARLGVHGPHSPGGNVTFQVAVYTGSTAPARVDVLYNGVAHAMDLVIGVEGAGIYEVEVPVDAEACGAYWFEVEKASGGVDEYPQSGAFGWGDCPWTDAEAEYLVREAIPALQGATEAPVFDEGGGCGCSSAPRGAGGWFLLGLLAVRRRR